MTRIIRNFLIDETGATSIEYALISSIISIAILATLQVIGPALTGKYEEISAGFTEE